MQAAEEAGVDGADLAAAAVDLAAPGGEGLVQADLALNSGVEVDALQ